MPLPAVCPGRPLERRGDTAPRGMTVLDRTRLTGRLRFSRAARGKSVRRFAPGAKHRAASRPGRRSNFHTPLTPPAFAVPDSGAISGSALDSAARSMGSALVAPSFCQPLPPPGPNCAPPHLQPAHFCAVCCLEAACRAVWRPRERKPNDPAEIGEVIPLRGCICVHLSGHLPAEQKSLWRHGFACVLRARGIA